MSFSERTSGLLEPVVTHGEAIERHLQVRSRCCLVCDLPVQRIFALLLRGCANPNGRRLHLLEHQRLQSGTVTCMHTGLHARTGTIPHAMLRHYLCKAR